MQSCNRYYIESTWVARYTYPQCILAHSYATEYILIMTNQIEKSHIINCSSCEGKGYLEVLDGEDDFVNIECGLCEGSGTI